MERKCSNCKYCCENALCLHPLGSDHCEDGYTLFKPIETEKDNYINNIMKKYSKNNNIIN